MVSDSSFLGGLARWSATAGGCSSAALAEARLALLDTLACIVAGAAEPQAKAAYAAMLAGEARGPTLTVAGPDGLSLPAAALVTGAAAHALDYDDYESVGATHPSVPILAATLPLAQLRGLSLGAVLDSFVVGYECLVRIGQALGYPHYAAGWHSTSTIGPFAAAAATARLLRLAPEPTAHALALAASMAAGLQAQFGSDAKAVHAGLAARAGLEAALLAAAGIVAKPDLMEVRYGFLDCYGAPGSPGRDGRFVLPGGSDTPAIVHHPILRKPWPSCSYTHRPIGAALTLARQVRAADIRSGVISLPEPYARVAPFIQPSSEAEARFSVPWCVAVALIDGEVSPQSFRRPALARHDVRALVDRLSLDAYATGPDLEDQSLTYVDRVSLVLADGRSLSETVAKVKGGPHDPMTAAELGDKFRLCGGAPALAQQILEAGPEQALRFW
jgi:2-methylcitrate dehydratase PrpD